MSVPTTPAVLTPGLRPWTGDAATYAAGSAALLAAHEPRVRAFTHLLDPEEWATQAAAATGPLAGMPVAVKEIIDVAGLPVTFGSPVFADRVPVTDAEAVRRLRAAGAVVVGTTTTTPFACGTTTVTDNPVAPGHTPGGSSAGSGAAVGAGFVPVALASQSQASTLRPAAYCGAYGFKPSHQRLPRGGMHLLADTLDDLGLVAASLADLATVFGVLAEPASPTPGPLHDGPPSDGLLRVGVLRLDDGGVPSPATRSAFDALVQRIAGDDVVVESGTASLGAVDAALAGSGQTCFTIFAGESAPTLAGHVAAGEPDVRLVEMVEHARAGGPAALRAALARREEWRAAWATLAAHHDVLLTLATTNPAPPGHASTGCRRMPATSSLLGVPALSAPWLRVAGLPQGVQLLGFEGRDEALLEAASRIETRLSRTPQEKR